MSTPKFSRLDPGQRREQILDAANTLFAERAYEDVSIEDIASSAGVTRGLVHHYFGVRRDVYIGLLERLGTQRESELRPPVGRSARARVADTVRRAVALVASYHADIAEDSPRLRHALECWTGLNRAATRKWLRGEATREATHELLTSTLEHVLRRFGARPTPSR